MEGSPQVNERGTLTLDGSSCLTRTGTVSLTSSSDFYLDCDIYPQSLGSWQCIFDVGVSDKVRASLCINTGKELTIAFNNATYPITAPTVLTAGQKYRVAYSYSNGTFSLTLENWSGTANKNLIRETDIIL